MSNNRKNNIRKERIIMIASSVLVMVALTVTGVYMRNQSSRQEDDGYSIDFSELDNQANDIVSDPLGNLAENEVLGEEGIQGGIPGPEDGLAQNGETKGEPDPMTEADSNKIEIPGVTPKEEINENESILGGQRPDDGSDKKEENRGDQKTDAGETDGEEENLNQTDHSGGSAAEIPQEADAGIPAAEIPQEADAGIPAAEIPQEGGAQEMAAEPEEVLPETKQLQYSEEQGLVRPTMGEVLMHYSMDGSIYFATLDQYKYNPAVMLRAAEGDSVMACAQGQVISVFEDEEIGQAIILDLGSGYQATYGQLKNLTVSVGSYVNAGDILGYVAAPTKYYSVEGTNVYFKLTKDNIPVNPETMFQ